MTTSSSEIRVVVADDSAAFRQTLCAFLQGVPRVRVVGVAADGDSAVTVAANAKADVVLLDLVMPRGGGSSAAVRIKSATPSTRVIFLSLLGRRELAHATSMTGADGFLCKADIDEELVPLLVERTHGVSDGT
ncbi:MAG TPA: response regulator transcription factor [Polyangiaceae bacterium]